MKTLFLSLLLASSLASATPSGEDKAKTIRELKSNILKIGCEASGKVTYDNEDNDPKVRAKLEPLIAELVKLAPPRTQAEKLRDVVGTWKSVWSDLTYYGPFAPRANVMYQVVFPTGYYYNLSVYDDPKTGPFQSVIKGLFTVQEPALGIKFVKTSRYNRLFPKGADLATLAMRAELGVYDEQVDSNNSPAIGFESTFEQVYVDDELRIGRGTNFTGAQLLFVLKRVQNFGD